MSTRIMSNKAISEARQYIGLQRWCRDSGAANWQTVTAAIYRDHGADHFASKPEWRVALSMQLDRYANEIELLIELDDGELKIETFRALKRLLGRTYWCNRAGVHPETLKQALVSETSHEHHLGSRTWREDLLSEAKRTAGELRRLARIT